MGTYATTSPFTNTSYSAANHSSSILFWETRNVSPPAASLWAKDSTKSLETFYTVDRTFFDPSWRWFTLRSSAPDSGASCCETETSDTLDEPLRSASANRIATTGIDTWPGPKVPFWNAPTQKSPCRRIRLQRLALRAARLALLALSGSPTKQRGGVTAVQLDRLAARSGRTLHCRLRGRLHSTYCYTEHQSERFLDPSTVEEAPTLSSSECSLLICQGWASTLLRMLQESGREEAVHCAPVRFS